MAAPKINRLLTPYNYSDKNDTGRIKYIVIHYVGALGGAKSNCQYYASKYIGASAHYYIGFGGEIWQSVGDEDIAWHCGAKSYRHKECRNTNSIGIELCVRKKNTASMNAADQDWYFDTKTVNAAVELTRYLMQKYGVDAEHVIRHYDVTGKICPNPYVYNVMQHTWDAFKKAIAENEAGPAPDTGSAETPGTAENAKGVPCTVTTTCDALRIRSGPGTGYLEVGWIRETEGKKKQYTIVEERNGWGRLKSGAGWISLSFTTWEGNTKEVPGFTPYMVNTTCDSLNIRSGAGMDYPAVGVISEREGKKNRYTIVEEKNGWGRLKSGAGWISLSRTKKVS